MLLRFLFICLYLISPTLLFAQSKSDVRERRIKSVDITSVDYRKNDRLRRAFTRYNRQGNPVEQIDYEKDGKTIENWILYTYDRKNRVITEVQLSPVGDTIQSVYTRYTRFKHVLETVTTNADGQVIEREIPHYDNYHRKTEELVLSGSGALIKKTSYEYDAKGMLISRKTYDKDGNLQYEKTYNYIY